LKTKAVYKKWLYSTFFTLGVASIGFILLVKDKSLLIRLLISYWAGSLIIVCLICFLIYNIAASNNLLKKYKTVLNSIDEGFCIIEVLFDHAGKPLDYRFIETNPAFHLQTGLHNPEGMLMRDLKPNTEEKWFEIYGKVALTGESIRFTGEAKEFNSWFSVYAFSVAKEEFGGNVAVIFRNITEETKAKVLIEKNLKIQEEIFTNVSHELKTPLSLIYAATQVMEAYLQNDSIIDNRDKLKRNFNVIKQNCNRLTRITNNVIDLSRIDCGFFTLNLSNQNIVNIVEGIVESVVEYVETRGLTLIFDTDIEELYMACDAEKIERIVLNLISNAIKFSNVGEEIFVNVSYKNQEVVEISVRDTGVGIDEEHINEIFKRFHQVDKSLIRNTEGSGIGLSLVQSLVDLLGGKISVESEIGKGSIFTVELPIKTVEYSKKNRTRHA
jgi:signal transduction histidine kinase